MVLARQSPRLISSLPNFIHPPPPVYYASRRSPTSYSAVCATSETSVVSVMLANDIQSFRNTFRAFFFPGIAILTFGMPLVIAGLIVASPLTEKTTPTTVTPRFTPNKLPSLRAVLLSKLLVSILIDLIGDGSLVVPGLGGASDFIWAPVSALLVRLLYGSNVLAAINLVEELLPFTDVIPTATIAFLLEFFFGKAELVEEAQPQQRQGGRRIDISDVVDIEATVTKDDEKKRKRD